jgi:hypothetical protein
MEWIELSYLDASLPAGCATSSCPAVYNFGDGIRASFS